MCQLMKVSRSGYLQWRDRPLSRRAQANQRLDVQVAALHAGSQRSYGRPRLVKELATQGQRVGHERVRQSLRRQGLRPVYRRGFRITTDSQHNLSVVPNVLGRRFAHWQPDQAWVGDVTHVRTAEGWLYLACVLDLASRRIVGWSMSERLQAQLVCDALRMAWGQRRPAAGLIMHSAYRKQLQQYGMVASMSRLANCWDNAVMESFFKTLKVERVDQMQYLSRAQARLDIVSWIEGFYNRKRLHSTIGYMTPCQADQMLNAA
jgi:transposase InsO family protein